MTWADDELAARVARDVEDGWAVNLGVGMPTSVAPALASRDVMMHSENGLLGMGGPPGPDEIDPDLVNAGKGPTTMRPGASIMDSVVSFTLIRGGRLDLSIMGAYQVSVGGDLANWRLPSRRVAGIGGAADLAVGAKQVWILMRYAAKDGGSRVVPDCTYPITARGCVSRVYTDAAVFVRREGQLEVVECAAGIDPALVSAETGCALSEGIRTGVAHV
jgi:3-oxoacid CoA-transferase B subunit